MEDNREEIPAETTKFELIFDLNSPHQTSDLKPNYIKSSLLKI